VDYFCSAGAYVMLCDELSPLALFSRLHCRRRIFAWLFASRVGIAALGIDLIGAAIYWRGSRLAGRTERPRLNR
jgi:hypothetical protein